MSIVVPTHDILDLVTKLPDQLVELVAQLTLNLLCGYAKLHGRHEVYGRIPVVIWQLATLKHCILAQRYALTALTALMGLPVRKPFELLMSALWTNHMLFL